MTGNAVDVALAVMDDLRACLCTYLEARSEPLCSCPLTPGAQAVPDGGCGTGGCGKAWVRLDRMYPSINFPSQDATGREQGTRLAAVIELGVLRCIPVSNPAKQGSPPTDVQLTDATILQLRDASAMFATLTCCETLTSRATMLGAYTPRDAGDLGGGVWPITVELTSRRNT